MTTLIARLEAATEGSRELSDEVLDLGQAFWEKVVKGDPDECWLWIAATCGSREKYGSVWLNGTRWQAHRLSYAAHNRLTSIPAGMVVRHSCDTPLCVNPRHLILGTQADNVRDMHEKGRNYHTTNPEVARRIGENLREFLEINPELRPRGERHGMAKLTERDVADIRSSSAGTVALAKRYGMHRTTITRIRNGELWAPVLRAREVT